MRAASYPDNSFLPLRWTRGTIWTIVPPELTHTRTEHPWEQYA